MNETISTRDRIVEAARDLFLVNGYNGTGMSQIQTAAGVRGGSLYYFFPTKEDLLLAVLDWYRTHIWEGLLQPVYERISDPVERIFGVLDSYRQLLLMFEFELGCPIGNLALEVSNSHPGVRALLQSNFDNWIEAIEICIQDARDRFPKEIEPKQIALFTLAVLEGGLMLSRTSRSAEPFEDSIAVLRDYYERLIRDEISWSAPRQSPLSPHEL